MSVLFFAGRNYDSNFALYTKEAGRDRVVVEDGESLQE
jgi:hypothetical protein